jgi:hypothetical protein
MKEKLEQELAAWKRRLSANQKNNLEAGIKKAEKEIARIEGELTELSKEPEKEPMPIMAKSKFQIGQNVSLFVNKKGFVHGKEKTKETPIHRNGIIKKVRFDKDRNTYVYNIKHNKGILLTEEENLSIYEPPVKKVKPVKESVNNSIQSLNTEKKWKFDSTVIKHSDEHYLVLYASDTKNDAEVKFVDGQWELICKQVKDYPKFKINEIEDAINFVLEIKHFIATAPERKANAKKANARAKIHANKPESKKVEEAVEKVAESVEEKIEELKEQGKKVPESTANSVILDVKSIISAVKSGMQANDRKKFINKLISELKKLL